MEDIQGELEAREKRLTNFRIPNQPLTIIVGPLDNIVACYVQVEDKRFNVCTPLKALDCTFKIIHSLNASYPSISEHVWCFIEQYIYEIKGANYTSVHRLIVELSK